MTERKVRLIGWVTAGCAILFVALVGIGLTMRSSPQPTSRALYRFTVDPGIDWRPHVDMIATSVSGICQKYGMHPTMIVDDAENPGAVDLRIIFGSVEREYIDTLCEKLKAVACGGNGIDLYQVSAIIFDKSGSGHVFAYIVLSEGNAVQGKAGKTPPWLPLD